MRRATQILAIAAVAIGWSFATARPVSAECSALDPWPPFLATVRAAERVVVGEVVEDRDPNSSHYLSVFGLRVDAVLRGNDAVGDVIEVAYLRTGLPTAICPDTHLWVLPGDVIALALDARGPDVRTRINSVAWIEGTPDVMQRGVGRISNDELRALVALPMTDIVPSRTDPAATTPARPVAEVVVVLVALVVVAGHTRRSGRRGQST